MIETEEEEKDEEDDEDEDGHDVLKRSWSGHRYLQEARIDE